MKDEIKEILFDMDLIVNHDKVPIYFTQNKVKLLLDYITNLQEELEKHKRYTDETFLYTYEELQDKVLKLQEENKVLNNVIQNIKNQLNYLETYSSEEDVFEDMKNRLTRIENIIKQGE